MERPEKAVSLHHHGYNCAQSVACAFCNILNENEETVFRLTEAFGAGMGCTKTCGAVTAMGIVIGMKESDGNLDKPGTKGKSYKLMKQAIKEFESMNGSIICSELKGIHTGTMLRSCDGCVNDAVEILDRLLFDPNEEK